jgi:ketosteroid isomerase-like protein
MNKTVWRAAPFSVWVVSGLLGCTMALAAPEPDRVALEAAVQRWMTAVNAQDVDRLTATMTEDVELLDANAATVTGRDAAIRALREVAARGKLVATSREVTIANDIAWRVVGLTQMQKNGDVHARGQALEIWKRVKGEWKLHRQMAAGVIAPADVLTRPPTGEPVLDQPRN